MEKMEKFEINKDSRFSSIEKLLFNIFLTLEDINNKNENPKNRISKKVLKKEVI